MNMIITLTTITICIIIGYFGKHRKKINDFNKKG